MDPKNVHVAYLTYDGLTDPLGQSQIIPYIIGLAKHGYQFTIFSFEKPDKLKILYSEIATSLNDLSIKWYPLHYTKQPPIVSTVWDIWALWKIYKKEYRITKFQITHCRSYITSIIGVRSKSKFGSKYIFDMRGFWADERVEGGLWNLKNPLYYLIYRYFKYKELQFLHKADAIISLTHVAKKILQENYNVGDSTIYVIPCCVDNELFDDEKIRGESKIALKDKLGIPRNDFVLIYVGSVGTWYMIDEMLFFFKTLTSINQKVSLIFLTKDDPEIVLSKAKEYGIDLGKIYVKGAERQQVPLYVSIADCGILFIRPTFSKHASFPTKLAEILSMGIPIITNSSIGDIDNMFNNYDLGILVKSFDKEQLLKAAHELLSKRKSSKLRDYALQNFSLKIGVDSYSLIYDRLN